MHPKEFKKVKNGTGRLTHLALDNSELFIGSDFTNHNKINDIIAIHDCFILYPSSDAINLTKSKVNQTINKPMAIFIIDSTWACSKKILRDSMNLKNLRYLSFSSTKLSQFKIKEQPQEHFLSTIESTLEVLELLNKWHLESIKKNDLDNFLNPFKKMVEYQLRCIANSSSDATRFKIR